ncbi:RagB/SusD family nutrient uptake outer membrane protein [uncultured Chitinophaga sp.]|uniref:RagB/SusD family nutrient uptake outer membrane protein n=1 Tax=uncultured Chitinophaga sp. TaxID=339340 RepID=UPI0026300794|nr:RagB/SusD family nutrient uptake outer membrane protein [uncultured Chitinophaga sp.]
MDNNNRLSNRSGKAILLHWILASFSIVMIPVAGCKKLIEVDPPIQDVVGSDIYSSNATAASVLTGIYSDMSNYGIFTGVSSIAVKTGLSADELVSVTSPPDILSVLYSNSLTNNGNELFWSDLYAYIFRTNAAIEGISASSQIITSVKQQLLGEARFLRAFMYFYLVNFYGDVPLLTNTDIKANSVAPRTNKDKVYEQIIQDLQDAQNNLNENYVGADGVTVVQERVRPNKAAATALLARAYLYTNQWSLAEQEASKLIAATSSYQLEAPEAVFLSTSKEAIWQLQPVAPSYNTLDAVAFILEAIPMGPNSSRPVFLSKNIFNAFEPGDTRKNTWIDSVTVDNKTYAYPAKYKVYLPDQPRTEYLTVLRLSEQYLIRGEARAQQGRLNGPNSAEEDINAVRSRAGLGPTAAASQVTILDAILQEKKVEFFTEWGHRWCDLKRTAKVDEVMNIVAPAKGGSWAAYKALYPIPVQDIQRNPSLKGHQNPGYPEQ